jgi:parallel beta-helix repeat protein
MWKILAFLCMFLQVTAITTAATLTVDLNGGADFTDIQSAIDAAADGETVLVKPGEYVIAEPIDFNRLHDPGDPESPPVKDIILKSEGGAKATTIRMAEAPANPKRASVVEFIRGETPSSVIEGFTLTGGRGHWRDLAIRFERLGGGIYCADSSPTIADCRIMGNSLERDGVRACGGGIFCGGGATPSLNRCTIAANSGGSGGIYCRESSSPIITDCDISGNSGGGVTCDTNSFPTFTGCTIAGNPGGGVNCGTNSFPTFTQCTIAGNSGYGVHCWGSPTLSGCIVWDHLGGSVSVEPGGNPDISFSCIEGDAVWPGEGNIDDDPLFCAWGQAAEVYVDNAHPHPGDGTQTNPYSDLASAFAFGHSLAVNSPCRGAGEGGADMGTPNGFCEEPGERARLIHVAAGRYSIAGSSFIHGVSLEGAGQGETVIEGTLWGLRSGAKLSRVTVTGGTGEGGIIVMAGERPIIEECAITANSGIGIDCWESSSPILTGCTITGSSIIGVSCRGSSILTNCTITGSTGYGVVCRDSSILTGCTISGNSGDGVYCSGSSTLTNCAITGNGGTGVSCRDSPTLTSCTIAGNSEGGLSCGDSSAPILTGCTIAGNPRRGMFCEWGSSPTLTNCILWNAGTIVLEESSRPIVTYSCIEGATVWLGKGNTDADPLFVAVGQWSDGGTPDDLSDDTWVVPGDYHLQPSSPAIDAGTSDGAPPTDIEGRVRPCGAGVDIGAYEFGDCARGFVRGDVDGKGRIDISDPIFLLGYLFLGGRAPDCLDAADANDDGILDLSDAVYSLTFQFQGGKAPKSPYPGCGIEGRIDALDCREYSPCE